MILTRGSEIFHLSAKQHYFINMKVNDKILHLQLKVMHFRKIYIKVPLQRSSHAEVLIQCALFTGSVVQTVLWKHKSVWQRHELWLKDVKLFLYQET